MDNSYSIQRQTREFSVEDAINENASGEAIQAGPSVGLVKGALPGYITGTIIREREAESSRF
jgi:hypothetical protein